MKIIHSKSYQHVFVDDICYEQYEAIVDILYTSIPHLMISSTYRKNLKTGFFVIINQALGNKIIDLFTHPPETALAKKATEKAKV